MKTYLSPATEFKILAHRGSTEGGAIENTLEAFRFASDEGIIYLETDVCATKDGIAVLFHDTNLARITGIKERLSNLTYRELQELDLPKGLRIPKLIDALERFPNSKFNLDLKTNNAIRSTAEAILKAKAQDRVLVSSFSSKRRKEFLNLLPNIATSSDAKTLLLLWLSYKLGFKSGFKKLLSELDALQIPISYGPIRLDDSNFIDAVHGENVEVHYWTVNDIEEAKRLRALGADGIVTDKGKMMIESLGNRKR